MPKTAAKKQKTAVKKNVAKTAVKKPVAKTTVKASAKPNKKAPAAVAKPAPKSAAKTVARPTPRKAAKPKRNVNLPAGYKPTDKEEYMNDMQVEYFRRKLTAWRDELLGESQETLNHLKEENWQESDMADRATLETDTGVELRTRNRYLKLVDKIDYALRLIDSGEYGFCEETGEPIGLKRLEARPIATLSIEAQERHERMERQYSDEEEA